MAALDDAAPILLLDVMSTLVWDPFVLMPEHFGMSWRELLDQKHPDAWVRFERDELSEDAFYRDFFADGRPIDGPGLRALMRDHYDYLPDIEPLLADLKAAGVAMHALSNYPRWYLMIEERLELSRYLEWTFVSCKTGYRKPEPDAYLIALATLGGPPERFIFVDDREGNCQAARALGMRAHRFESAERLRADLAGVL